MAFKNESLSSIFSRLLSIAGRVVQTQREVSLMQQFGEYLPEMDVLNVLYRQLAAQENVRLERINENTGQEDSDISRKRLRLLFREILGPIQHLYVSEFGWSNNDSIELRAAGVKMFLDFVLLKFARPVDMSDPYFPQIELGSEAIASMLWQKTSDREKFSDSKGDEHTELVNHLLHRLKIKDSELANISRVLVKEDDE